VRTCVSNRDTDPPIQKLLHAVDILCISYYEAFQRKKRANSWNDCHSRIECLDSKSVIKNMSGFRACNFQHVSLASGRTVFSSCGADPSKAKKRLSSPNTTDHRCVMPAPAARTCWSLEWLRSSQRGASPPSKGGAIQKFIREAGPRVHGLRWASGAAAAIPTPRFRMSPAITTPAPVKARRQPRSRTAPHCR
jgi:hypothetical protein